MSKFVFRSNSSVKGVDAQVVGEELQKLQQAAGAVRAHEVVDAARPEEAPLHPAFEWDDSVAGEKYRIWQARMVIRSVQVLNDESDQPQTVYVNVTSSEGEREYQPMSAVVEQPDLYAQAIAEAQKRINSARAALDELHAAASGSDIDGEKLAVIAIAMQSLATAQGAVAALH